jgi:branched-chain amino acid transport system substrate-binding protein
VAASFCAERERIPLISLSGPVPGIERKHGFTHWAGFSSIDAGRLAARFCRNSLHAEKAVVIRDNREEVGVATVAEFKKTFEEMGGQVVRVLGVSGPGSHLIEVLDNVKRFCPDVIFAPVSAFQVAFIAKRIESLGLRTQIVAGARAEHKELIEIGGKSVEGLLLISGASNADWGAGKRLVELRQRIEEGSGPWAASGARAYRILIKAVEDARSTDASAVCEALAIQRDSTKEKPPTMIGLRRVDNGRFVSISDGSAQARLQALHRPVE